jgi:hypothetical protein
MGEPVEYTFETNKVFIQNNYTNYVSLNQYGGLNPY